VLYENDQKWLNPAFQENGETMPDLIWTAMGLILAGLLVWLAYWINQGVKIQKELPESIRRDMEEKHCLMLKDLHDGLTRQSDRLDEKLGQTLERVRVTLDERLDQISGRVSERLDEGFKKTTETFTHVMTRLAAIDEAQKKIDGLTTNIVSLQELLGDKRSRGAFGEVQLEALVRNILPPGSYAMQHTLSNGARVDCALFLPEPTGLVGVDSKFPLENFNRMFADGASEAERAVAQKAFAADVRKHIDDISQKYILAGETSEGAVMFVPAEAVFAEIHAYHADVVDYALQRRVWIVSPTTLMAVLNTARAVLKDVETRKQIHIIKDELGKLGKDFELFDRRMKSLADHIRLANKDVEEVHRSSQKISQRFAKIERVELEQPFQASIAGQDSDDTP
jgi:DNA recombination protein RmuC